MKWQYGLLKTMQRDPLTKTDSPWYELVETYGGVGYAKDIRIAGESIHEVIGQVHIILDDLKKNLKIIEDGK
jgi:hypothetical protein